MGLTLVNSSLLNEIKTNNTLLSEQIQNFSRIQDELQNTIIQSQNIVLWLVLIFSILLLLILIMFLYTYFKKRLGFKVIIKHLNTLHIYYFWKKSDTVLIDNFKYIVNARGLLGNYIMFDYHNPECYIFKDNELSKNMLNYDLLNKSTIIEKTITADDFMTFVKTLIIIIIVLVVLSLILNYFTLQKEMVCILNLDNYSSIPEAI